MKKIFYFILVFFLFISCLDSTSEEPISDKLAILSGGNPEGKGWNMVSFVTKSNYFTFDVKQFLTYDSWDTYPESIKDNTFIIFPSGEISIDEGNLLFSNSAPQVYEGLHFWELNAAQDSVNITDYVGLPSIHDKWGLHVTTEEIILTRQQLDIGFEGSSLTQQVTFKTMHLEIQ